MGCGASLRREHSYAPGPEARTEGGEPRADKRGSWLPNDPVKHRQIFLSRQSIEALGSLVEVEPLALEDVETPRPVVPPVPLPPAGVFPQRSRRYRANMAMGRGFVPDARGDDAAVMRKQVWISQPLHFAAGPVDLEAVDIAGFVNACAEHADVHIPMEEMFGFNADWRSKLREMFLAEEGGVAQLEEFLATGRSNDCPMRLQILALCPDTWFRVHAHASIELIYALAGELWEWRLTNACVEGKFVVEPGSKFPRGPDLKSLKSAFSSRGQELTWESAALRKGHYLSNLAGTVHQSYTCNTGATLLVLWSGAHANISPEDCMGVCQHLKPSVGLVH
uniref:Uncharacterized protein n=1 Tax=Alexandrium monilatum TaxID=311494 RepID=A0A7S4UC08_9DINO